MGLRDRVRGMFGGAGGDVAALASVPPVAELLAPSLIMEKEWRRAARADAIEFGDNTRAELGREFGTRWFPNALPSDLEERRSRIERSLMARSERLYAEHLHKVQGLFDLPNTEIAVRFEVGSIEVPRRDRPLERAMAISAAVIAEEETDRHMEVRLREMQIEKRLTPPSASDWQEHKAADPALLAAERGGDLKRLREARRVFMADFQLRDPTLREIAITVVAKADGWDGSTAEDLASGQVWMDPSTARRLVISAMTYEPGRRRDSALVEAYLDDCSIRNPKVVEVWNRQALEAMAEGPAFLRTRYGGVDTDGMSVRQIVSLEAMRMVAQARAAEETRRSLQVMPDRMTGAYGLEPAVFGSSEFSAMSARTLMAGTPLV